MYNQTDPPGTRLRSTIALFVCCDKRIYVCAWLRVCVCVCVCVFVCLSTILSPELLVRSSNFFVHITCDRGSILFWQRRDTLRISGFVDDVILHIS